MSQLRTWNAKRAVARVQQTTVETTKSATRLLIQSKISSSLPPKEMVRQMRAKRLVIRN